MLTRRWCRRRPCVWRDMTLRRGDHEVLLIGSEASKHLRIKMARWRHFDACCWNKRSNMLNGVTKQFWKIETSSAINFEGSFGNISDVTSKKFRGPKPHLGKHTTPLENWVLGSRGKTNTTLGRQRKVNLRVLSPKIFSIAKWYTPFFHTKLTRWFWILDRGKSHLIRSTCCAQWRTITDMREHRLECNDRAKLHATQAPRNRDWSGQSFYTMVCCSKRIITFKTNDVFPFLVDFKHVRHSPWILESRKSSLRRSDCE